MRFSIEGSLPAMNEIVNAAKTHWVKYRAQKTAGMTVARAAIRRAKKEKTVKATKSRVKILFSHYCEDRRKDPDNIASGAQKITLDALQEEGVLENDGHKNIAEIHHRFFFDKKNPRIEVEMAETV